MNGFFNIFKPAGMSSAAVVGTVKRLTGERRVGHAGTLDPEAAGILPIMVGRATRLFDYLADKEKEYVTVCAFGTATDTQDFTGTVLARGTDYPDASKVREMLPRLEGDILQKPSMYSAIKVGGHRLYELARKGENAEVPERMVRIENIELLREMPDHGFELRVTCGRGTYIRTLCHDLGLLCGCPAHMRSLTRTRSGAFTLETAIALEDFRQLSMEGRLEEKLIPMDGPIQNLPRMEAPGNLTKKVMNGMKLPMREMIGDRIQEGAPARVYLNGDFWGIAERRGEELVWRAQMPPERTEV